MYNNVFVLRFVSNIVGSPIFNLLSNKNRKTMKEKKVNIFRYQTNLDERLGFLARQMFKKNILYSTFVSRNTINMVIPNEGDKPAPVYSEQDLQKFYDGQLSEFDLNE